MQDIFFKIEIDNNSFPAAAVWNESCGFYCGYVGIEENNGLYKLNLSGYLSKEYPDKFPDVDVHGGITYSDYYPYLDFNFKKSSDVAEVRFDNPSRLVRFGRESRCCRGHVSAQPLWWIGFDCGHFNDKTNINTTGVERGIDFVKINCRKIAELACSSYEKLMRKNLSEEEHNEMLALAIMEDEFAKEYVKSLSINYFI